MKKINQIGILFLALILSTSTVLAEAKTETKKEMKNQTHCPVMGGKIDSTVFTDIQGHRVYHCCPGCSNSLKKDPDTFFKKAAAEGIIFENIQNNCPVSGAILEEKSIYSDFEGRRIYFCSENCIELFDVDPQKYLKKISVKEKKKEKEGHDHNGHTH